MTDRILPNSRSTNMSHIHSKDTKIEQMVRRYLFSQGFRFWKNCKQFPGTPDVVLPKYKTVIFVNGCFWHQHQGCKYATMPNTRRDFWSKKLSGNVVNDKLNRDRLEFMGWKVITIWECELEKNFNEVMSRVVHIIKETK